MLPGGMDIIGIFAMAPPAVMTTVQNKLKLVGRTRYPMYFALLSCYIFSSMK